MLSVKNERIFSLCLDEATKSGLLYQHGCIATCGGKILARGCNTTRRRNYSDIVVNNTCSCHAEISVIHKINNKFINTSKEHKRSKTLKKTTLYISRVKDTEDNSYNSAPCKDCLNIIQMYHIKRIIFYLNDRYYVMNPRDYTTDHQSYGQIYMDKLKRK